MLMHYKKWGAALMLLALSSCKKLDLAPQDRFTELTFWQSNDNVNNLLNSIYGGLYSSTQVFYNEALSDNAVTRVGISAGFPDAIASGNFTPTLPRFRNDWAFYYQGIKNVNLFLDGITRNTSLSQTLRNRMIGEARFIRAWHYFNLSKWWGDVPLVTTNITEEESKQLRRTPRAEVINFVLTELAAAEAALPKKEDYGAPDRGRIAKGAAVALKARVLLYQGNRMQEVVTECEKLINNSAQYGNYSLVPNYGDVFSPTNEYNAEVILDLQYVAPQRTWTEYIDFSPISAGARTNNLAPTQELVNSYLTISGKPITDATSGYDENNPYVNRDPRLTATIVYDGYQWKDNPSATARTIYIKPGSTPGSAQPVDEYKPSGQGTATGYYWRKYYDHTSVATGYNSGLNIILIRYAEVLLMYAEAKQSLGQMDAATWNLTIRALRNRAGFTDANALNLPVATGDALRDIIRNERRVELAMEGFRIDDIRRWRIAQTVLNGWARGAKFGDPGVDNGYLRVQLRTFDANKNYLWPVPDYELGLNAGLGQNPNY
jgi:starch-binding outer membrane protein, SusD/RagB family